MSSAGYLGLKALENNPRNQVGAPSRGTAGDELIDADPAATTPAEWVEGATMSEFLQVTATTLNLRALAGHQPCEHHRQARARARS